jgi:catechol 2,3-dioxygenase-like lactoylglutathione lyase family enzyme
MTTSSEFAPSILSHVSLGSSDLPPAKAFYDAVLATLHIGVGLGEPRRGGLRARLPGILGATAA